MKLVLSGTVLRSMARSDVAEAIVSWYNTENNTNHSLSTLNQSLTIYYRHMHDVVNDSSNNNIFKSQFDNAYDWDWEYLLNNTSNTNVCTGCGLKALICDWLYNEMNISREGLAPTIDYLYGYISHITDLYTRIPASKFTNVPATSLADYTAASGYVQKVAK